MLVTTLRLPTSNEIEPLKEFDDMFSCNILERLHNVVGMVEVRLLEPNDSFLKDVRLPKHEVIGPDRLLPSKYKSDVLSS